MAKPLIHYKIKTPRVINFRVLNKVHGNTKNTLESMRYTQDYSFSGN